MNIIAILSLFLLTGCGTYENPALQSMIEAWPNIAPSTIRLLITLPSFFSTITMVVIGQIVGKKIGYRPCLIVGAILSLTCGILPFFIHSNWYFILFTRILLGFGVGLLSIRNSLLILSVEPSKLAKLIGFSSVLSSFMNALISPVIGKISELGWHYAFLGNSIVLISLILTVLFIKEVKVETKEFKTKTNGKLPKIMYVFFIIQFISTLVLYPLLSGISSYFAQLNIGNATLAGLMLSIYTGAGIFSNLMLSKLQMVFKQYLLPLFLSFPFIGLILVLISKQIVIIGIGVFLSGMGFITLSSSLQVYAGLFCNKSVVPKASTMLLACTQLGVFLSSYFIDFTSSFHIYEAEMIHPYVACMITYFVLAIFAFIFKKKMYPSN